MTQGVITGDDGVRRCWWGTSTPTYQRYHDGEWGRPTKDDRWIFEKLCLEGFQSGLSWLTILNKRENFRAAFANFEFEKVARFNSRSVERLLAARGESPRAAWLGPFGPGGVAKPRSTPGTASFRLLPRAEKPSSVDTWTFTTGC